MKRLNKTAADVLAMLREKNEPLSGQEMAGRLDLSRAAVWKAVDALRSDGYGIEGIHKAGYLLTLESPGLTPEGIRSRISPDWGDLDVVTYSRVTSTNSLAKERAGEGRTFLLAAHEQTAGRGRRGRAFYSPPGSGLYFTLGFPWRREEAPVLLTTMAAAAAARVLENNFQDPIGIKWVNDLFLKDKKIAGILTEAVTDLETGTGVFIVLGLGINLMPPSGGFPEDLEGIAGSLLREESQVDRSRLTAEIVNELGRIIGGLPSRDYLDDYRNRCFILGREVLLPTGERVRALEISDEGSLLVQGEKGPLELSSGEISLAGF